MTVRAFIRELTRRRVVRSAGAYIIVTWVLIQVASIFFPEFGAPEWSMRALIMVCIVGFPPAMLLAWTVDISGFGLELTPDSQEASGRGARLALVLVSTVLSSLAMVWAWDDYIVRSSAVADRVSTIKAQPVVAVNPPRAITGRGAEDWLGEGVANLIRSELAESRHVIVMAPARWGQLIRGAKTPEQISRAAASAGVDYLVDGEFIELPKGLVLTLHIEDIENALEIDSARATGVDAAAIIGQIPQLSTTIKMALKIPHTEKVGLFEADFAARNVAAYEAYVAGLAFFIDFQYEAAQEALQAALESAPDLHIARYRLAMVYEATGRSEQALATLKEIPADAPVSERFRMYVRGATAYFAAERDTGRAIEVFRELVEKYPYEVEAGQYLAEAYWLNFEDEKALAEFRRMSQLHPHDPTAWMALAERLLDVGEVDEAGAAIARFVEMAPTDAYGAALQGRLALLRGDWVDAVRGYELALSRKPGFIVARLGLATATYLRGDAGAAALLWEGIALDTTVAPAFRIDAVFDLAGILRGSGQFRQSIAAIDALLPLIRSEGLRYAMALSQKAQAHGEIGEWESADTLVEEAIRAAGERPARYLFAQGTLELAREQWEALGLTAKRLGAGSRAEAVDPDQRRAGSFLEGLRLGALGNHEAQRVAIEAVLAEPGYDYGIYKLGLAQAYFHAGHYEEAAQFAQEAARERAPGDPRLDLELDRARAQLLRARALSALGEGDAAAELANQFLQRWLNAPREHADLQTAQLLAGP